MIRVLVIEDENELLNNIVETLNIHEYEAIGASNGLDGLKLAQTHQPDIVICDIMMPEMDGFEVLNRIRSSKETSLLPFIFLTAKTDWASIRQGMESGADDYLLKPFTVKELLKAIKTRIERIITVQTQASAEFLETKRQLANVIALELKDPLESVNATVQKVIQTIDALSLSELQNMLQSINSNANQLTRLTEQIIYFVQAKSGLMATDKIMRGSRIESIQTVILTAIHRTHNTVPNAHDITINFDANNNPLDIRCFREFIIYTFSEILSSIMLFSDNCSVINIDVYQRKTELQVKIYDNGNGIENNNIYLDLNTVEGFDSELAQQGVGIGLAIAKLIIESHKGHLDIQSELGKGTIVNIYLPIDQDEA